MANPFLIALMGAQLLGGGMQARGQLENAKADAEAASFNAAVTEVQGAQKEMLIRRRAKSYRGTMRTAVAKAGVRLEGSPLEAIAASAAAAEMDALNTRFEAQASAKLDRMRGSTAIKQGKIGAASTMLSTIGSVGTTAFSLKG